MIEVGLDGAFPIWPVPSSCLCPWAAIGNMLSSAFFDYLLCEGAVASNLLYADVNLFSRLRSGNEDYQALQASYAVALLAHIYDCQFVLLSFLDHWRCIRPRSGILYHGLIQSFGGKL
jgi:hypothetical protein